MTTTAGRKAAAPARPGSLSDRLCAHVADTRPADLPDEAVARAKVRLLDCLGNIAAGHGARGNAAVVGLATRWGGAPEATVLVHGQRVPAPTAAWVNAVMVRSYDFEPVGAEGPDGRRAPAHISGTTVPVALAVAERTGSTGRDLLAALVLGDDVAARLAVASGFDVYSGQDNTGTVNALGGTAVAARLMGLDADRLRHALGIALNQLSGTVANIYDQTPAFKLPMAFAARNSIVSAELAELGFTGPADPIAGRHGFLEMYCADPSPELVDERLGVEFYADTVIKPWPACRASHPSLDACVRLVATHGLDPARIRSVRIHTTPRTLDGFVGQEFAPGECPEVSGAFSIRFTAATALLHGTVRPEHLDPARMRDPRLVALLGRIDLVGSLPPRDGQTAEVEVLLDDGTRLHQHVDSPRGDLRDAPLSESEVLDKYFSNVEFGGTIPRRNAERAVELVDRLEGLASPREILSLFSPAP